MCTRMVFSFPVQLLFIMVIITACTGSNLSSTRGEQSVPPMLDSERRLNQVYNEVLHLYRDDPVFTEKLKAAQRQWHLYRDAQIEALYPVADKMSAYGSVYPSCYRNEKQRLELQRTEELMRWVEGHPEGDVCGGSIRTR